MKNMDIRVAAEKARVRLYEIAEALNITDSSFSRRLRKELSEAEKQRIRQIIADLRQGE